MKGFRIIVGGVVAGLLMTGVAWWARTSAGLQLDAEMILGTLLDLPPSRETWLMGLGIHLVLSILIATLYGIAFEAIAHRAGAGPGFAFSVVHVLMAGMVLGTVPEFHPLIPEELPSPGPFAVNFGAPDVGLFIVERLVFGMIVGIIYGSVPHPRRRPALARA